MCCYWWETPGYWQSNGLKCVVRIKIYHAWNQTILPNHGIKCEQTICVCTFIQRQTTFVPLIFQNLSDMPLWPKPIVRMKNYYRIRKQCCGWLGIIYMSLIFTTMNDRSCHHDPPPKEEGTTMPHVIVVSPDNWSCKLTWSCCWSCSLLDIFVLAKGLGLYQRLVLARYIGPGPLECI